MCELKLSLGLVVRIFVHLSSNSEMNMFIYNYILHIIYQAAMYFTFKVPKCGDDSTMAPGQYWWCGGGGGMNPPSERV